MSFERGVLKSETPNLREIHIGSSAETSFNFANCPAFVLTGLESLEEVEIGQGCFVFANVLSLQSLPRLKTLCVEKDSFFYMQKLVLMGKDIYTFEVMCRRSSTRALYNSSHEFAAPVNQTD